MRDDGSTDVFYVIASQRVGAKRRPMTGSAKQSIAEQIADRDCFGAEFIIGPAEGGTRWLLAMTVSHRWKLSNRFNKSARRANHF
jgi:hypothetical protein